MFHGMLAQELGPVLGGYPENLDILTEYQSGYHF
jgi:hypothetical protein